MGRKIKRGQTDECNETGAELGISGVWRRDGEGLYRRHSILIPGPADFFVGREVGLKRYDLDSLHVGIAERNIILVSYR